MGLTSANYCLNISSLVNSLIASQIFCQFVKFFPKSNQRNVSSRINWYFMLVLNIGVLVHITGPEKLDNPSSRRFKLLTHNVSKWSKKF